MTDGAARQHGERQPDAARRREAPTQDPAAPESAALGSAAPGFMGPGAWLPSVAGVLRLQELVGNRVVGSLMRSPLGPEAGVHVPFGGLGVQRQEAGEGATATEPAPAPGAEDSHEILRPGDGPDVEVGRLQQALNAVGSAIPPLRITAVFGPETTAAVIAFQTTNPPLVPDGVVGLDTWAKLDELAPRVTRQGRETVEGPTEAAPRGTPENGTTHPTVRYDSRGPAVEELQQKLNTVPPDQVPTLLEVDGIFGSQTQKAVREFQASRTPAIDVDGVVGPITWGELDAVAGPVTVGREEFEWRERVEGREFFGTSNFTWRLLDDRLQITVNIRFTGAPDHPRVAQWRNDITTVWNEFKFVDQATNEELLLEFVVGSGSPADASVRVVVTPEGEDPGRSDAANWHTGDTDPGLAPHEFGHLIGLQDEYNRGPEAYTVVTGEQPRIGEVDAPLDASGNPVSPDAIAAEIAAAARIDPPAARAAAVRAIVDTKYNLDQGAFATRVAEAYEIANAADMQREDFVTGTGYTVVPDPAGTIANDLAARMPGMSADETVSVRPFLISNRSIMGEMQSLNSPISQHDHPVAERHVRHFLDIVATNRPGDWTIERQ
jgi:peptidoglycan hydrolase-like protein with peptidoglycan-binding domain